MQWGVFLQYLLVSGMSLVTLTLSYTTKRMGRITKNGTLWASALPCTVYGRTGRIAFGFQIYLLSRNVRLAMCCSRDLTPKPLEPLPFRVSSLTGVLSCFSLQCWGEDRQLQSDWHWNWREKVKLNTNMLGFDHLRHFFKVTMCQKKCSLLF